MNYYLGPLGDLRELPPIERDQKVTKTADGPQAETEGLEGGVTIDRLGRVRRTWVLPWVYLTSDEKDQLDALRRGIIGTPLYLLDPTIPNLAHPLVATAGSERRTARFWAATTGNGLQWNRLPALPPGVDSHGAIAWTRPTTAVGTLTPGRGRPSQRAPVAPWGGPLAVRAMVRRTSPDPVVASLGLTGWNSDTTGYDVTGPARTIGTDWLDLTMSWTAPLADVLTFSPILQVAAGQPASTIEVAAVSMGYGALAPPYSLGGGASKVTASSMTESQPSDDEWDVTLTLLEV